MHRRNPLLLAAILATLGTITSNVVAIPGYVSGTYTENFNSLPYSGATNNVGWVDDTTLAGWFYSAAMPAPGVGAVPSTTLTYQRLDVSTGGATNGGMDSFGATSNVGSDRSFGSVASNTLTQFGAVGNVGAIANWFGLRLRNNSGSTLTSFTLGYDGKQWRDMNTAVQKLDFSYALDAASLQDTTFTDVDTLDFSSPIHAQASGGSGASVAGNSTGKVTFAPTTISGLNWEPGQDLWLRWSDVNDTGTDHDLAIDNVSFSATPGSAAPASPTYNADASGNWSDSANWLNGAPAAANTLVRLGSQITAARTLTLDVDASTGTLLIGGSKGYTLTGTNTLTIDNGAGGGTINAPTGTNVVDAPVHFAGPAAFTVGNLGTLTVSKPITAAAGQGLTKSGLGTLVLTAANSLSGTVAVNGGYLNVSDTTQLGDASPTNNLAVDNGGMIRPTAALTTARTLTVGAANGGVDAINNITLGAVSGPGMLYKSGAATLTTGAIRTGGIVMSGIPTTASSGTVKIAPDGTNAGVSRINFLAISTDATGTYLGKVDLSNNALVYDYTGPSPLTDTSAGNSKVVVALGYAYNNGAWNNTGLTSTLPGSASDPNKATSVGYAEASELLGLSGTATDTWLGQTVDATSLLVRYTIGGDANLNGKIDADDYALVDRSIAKGTWTTHFSPTDPTAGLHAHWVNGDFNYDGAVDQLDMLILDKGLQFQSPGSLTPDFLAARETQFGQAYVSALLASVPEPTTLSLLGVAATPLLSRRRRRTI